MKSQDHRSILFEGTLKQKIDYKSVTTAARQSLYRFYQDPLYAQVTKTLAKWLFELTFSEVRLGLTIKLLCSCCFNPKRTGLFWSVQVWGGVYLMYVMTSSPKTRKFKPLKTSQIIHQMKVLHKSYPKKCNFYRIGATLSNIMGIFLKFWSILS